MALSRPPHIPKFKSGFVVDWPWDDWNVEQSYQPGDAELAARMIPLSRRAKIAMTIAIAEWIVFRLEIADPDPTAAQYLEAAWAGLVRHEYCPYVEFVDHEWSGPVRGPLHLAMALVNDALHFEGANVAENASWTSQLAQLVLPRDGAFPRWKAAVLPRLERWFPTLVVADDDFNYDWEASEPLVPRECFDPDLPFDPSLSTALTRQYLVGIDYVDNPFLSTPDDLREVGTVPFGDIAS